MLLERAVPQSLLVCDAGGLMTIQTSEVSRRASEVLAFAVASLGL